MIDKDIELQDAGNHFYWSSGCKHVGDIYVFEQYKKLLARIAELELMIAARGHKGTPRARIETSTEEEFLMGTRRM